MLEISKVPAKYDIYSFQKNAANIFMEDYRITDEDKKAVTDYCTPINFTITQMNELKKDDFTLEDGKQTDLEKSYLANPNDSKLSEDLRDYYLEEIEKIYPDVV